MTWKRPPVVVQVGNQAALYGTEAAYRDGYTAAGCVVLGFTQDECLQRGQTWLYDRVRDAEADLLVYSRTHSPTALTPDWTALWRRLEDDGTRTAGAHLDLFWGLPEREGWIRSGDPMFTLGTVFTADGGSDELWTEAGVNHRWLPPACDTRFIPPDAEPIPELAHKILFVGSSRGYHSEYAGRMQLIAYARSTWPDRFVEYGGGTPNGVVRGVNLARIYASDCICLGDSCFAGQRKLYWSDRAPECLGRGGFLIHPWLPGLRDWYNGAQLATFKAGDMEDLAAQVGAFDANPGEREGYRERGRQIVLARDTYRHRARQVLDAVGVQTHGQMGGEPVG